MTKEEARKNLKKAESNLRLAEIISEEHEKAIKEIKEDIKKLKAIINKKDNWRLVEVPDSWQELYEEKALLMADMMHFAYVRNEGWLPDWENYNENKYGLYATCSEVGYFPIYHNSDAVFGITVKSIEIAKEMLEEFGNRIKKIYNKQY